ncbi:MAG: methylmalonyl-CoA mutase [Actinobacteria bacterium]|nr:MAG: methylmalonyl-CoA mutase [Actinomycetota bacterium]
MLSVGENDRTTPSGIPIEPLYEPSGDFDVAEIGRPGEFPYVRGVYPDMYRGKVWTMRQYAGYATAAESNARYRYLLDHGQTGLSVAFDLPTQMGYDSDDPVAEGEVGKVGVAIDSLEDMRALFAGIPLDRVSTSMTINAPASVLLLLYQLVGEEQGVDPPQLTGTIQNDIYHMGEKGATAVQEIAFTLADAIAYVDAAIAAGLPVDRFGPRLSFFFVARTTLFEEVAKFRAARKLWAEIMRDRFGAKDARSQMLRFHTQTAGVQLTAQQPQNNIVRVAIQALAAVLGGTQSLHANSFDEALALPTEHAAKIALRTQQIIAAEAGVVETADPLGGSWFVEELTKEIEQGARDYIAKVDEMGGAVKAIEYMQGEIEQSAYEELKAIESKQRQVIGVNTQIETDEQPAEILRVDPAIQAEQMERVRAVRANRDQVAAKQALEDLRDAAKGTDNLLPPMREALRAMGTVGEVCGVMRDVFGMYKPRR